MPSKSIRLELLQRNTVIDLVALRGLRLRALDLAEAGKPVTDLSPLIGMPLESLTVARVSAVVDLTPLTGMPLEELRIVASGPLDISPLAGMPLKRMVLWAAGVSDLTPLEGMPLSFLSLAYSEVVDIEPLRHIRPPQRGMHLQLTGTRVSDLSPLTDVPCAQLMLSWSDVRDLSPLEGQPLRCIAISGLDVDDLSPLAGAPLERFYFSPGTLTASLEPLRSIPTLEKFGLNRGQVDEAAELDRETFWKWWDTREGRR